MSGAGRLNKDIYTKESSKSGIAFHQGDVLYGKLRPYLQNWLLPAFDGLAVGDFWVLQPQNADSSFLYRLIQSRQFDEVANQSTGTKMPRADWKLVSKTVFSIPSNIGEQAAIGTYFTALDNIITLHQRQPFMHSTPEISLTVQLIHPFYTSSWEQRKGIDIADYSKGNGYSKGDLTDAGTPIILYGRLYTKYQFAISEVDTFAVPRNGAVYSQGNEVIVPASGETAEDIARASAVEKSGVLLGGDLNILRPFDFINPLFLALAISNGEPQKELAKKAQGKSVVHIHNTDIQEVTIAYPSKTEQDRIVSVFRNLDNLITLHQRKCALLFSSFQALISMMFTTSTFSWEQRKFFELYERVSRKNDLTYGRNDIISVANMYFKPDSYITDDSYLLTYNIFELGDIAFEGNKSKNYAHGRFVENTIGNGIVSHVFDVFKPIMNPYDLLFWKYAINNERLMGSVLLRSTKASTMMTNLVATDFLQESFLVPTYPEQQKIGAFFSQLDNLITLHQRKPFLMKWRTSDANRNQTNRLVL